MQYRNYLLDQNILADNIVYLNFESFDYQWVKIADDFERLIQEKLPSNQDKTYFKVHDFLDHKPSNTLTSG